MATPTPQQIQAFLNQYDNYCTYTRYAVQWIDTIIAAGNDLQANICYPNYLTTDQKSAISANITAAQNSTIVAVPV